MKAIFRKFLTATLCGTQVLFAPVVLAASYEYNVQVKQLVVTAPTNPTAPPTTPGPGDTGTPTPGLTPSTGSYDFGDVLVGASASHVVTLRNTGTAPSTGVYASLSATGYRVTENQCGTASSRVTLAAGDTCTVTVQFQPTTLGSALSSLAFASDATTGHINLSGTGTAPVLSASTSTVDFSTVNIGAAFTLGVRLTNTGTATATFSSAPALTGNAAFAFPASGSTSCGATLTPGAYCDTSVTFAPTASGTVTGTLSFASNVSGSPTTVSLTGSGAQPQLAVDYSTRDFGAVTVGSTGSTTVTLSNTGNATASGVWAAVPQYVGLAITSNQCGTSASRVSLAPGASCQVTVTYTPTGVQFLAASSLTFTSGSTIVSTSFTGQGSGTLSVSPVAGVVAGGNAVTLTATNGLTGTPTVTFNGVAATSVSVVNGTTLTAITPAGTAGPANVVVTLGNGLTWATPGAYVYGNTTITATGAAVSGSTVSLGSTTQGTSTTTSLTIANASSTVATPLSLSITGNSEFTKSASSTCAASLAPSATCTLIVVYTPQVVGTSTSGTLTISGSGTVSAFTLTGSGTAPVSYMVFDASTKAAGTTLSNGNLTVFNTSGYGGARTSAGRSSGVYYFEVTLDTVNTANSNNPTPSVGVVTSALSMTSSPATSSAFTGFTGQAAGGSAGMRIGKGNSLATYYPAPAAGDVIGVLTDFNNNSLTIYRNGTAVATRTSVFTAGQTYYPYIGVYNNQGTANFGQNAWKHPPPPGSNAALWTN